MKGDLENALIYAKKVIDSGKFPLEDKLNIRSFMAGTITEKEAVWGVYTTQILDNVKKNFYTYDMTYTWLPADDIRLFIPWHRKMGMICAGMIGFVF